MTNKEKYDKAFIDALSVEENELAGLVYHGIDTWDSIGHMEIIANLEDAFDIMIDTDDIIEISSYKKGMEILAAQYDITFE